MSVDLFTLARYYLLFRTYKLNFIHFVVNWLLNYVSNAILWIFYGLKLAFGDDLRELELNDFQESKVRILYVGNNYLPGAGLESNDDTIRYLWRWRSSINVKDLTGRSYIIFEQRNLLRMLLIDSDKKTYRFTDIRTGVSGPEMEIMFDDISFLN